MINNVNFGLRGQDPLGLSDGEGVVGVSTTPVNTKKKFKKKIREADGGRVKIYPILIGKVWKRQ